MTDMKTNNVSPAVLEFHVHDLEEAIAYCGDEVAKLVVQGLRVRTH